VYIYYENTENFGQERIMILGGLKYSCMRNQNLQCVTVVVARGQRSDPFYMLHGTLSYGRRMRYEILVCCDFEIFVALRLLSIASFFLLKDFRPDPSIRGI